MSEELSISMAVSSAVKTEVCFVSLLEMVMLSGKQTTNPVVFVSGSWAPSV